MKKILAIILSVLMLIGLLAGCGSKDASNDTTAAANNATNANADAETEAKEEALQTVEEGKLIMATNAQFPPYEFYEGEKITGIDAEIAEAIAAKLGLELVIVDMEFDSIVESVKSGKADIGLAGMTITDERKESVNFTVSYATGVQAIIVTEGSAITCADDLFAEGAFTTIGVQRNTTGDLYTTWDLEDKGMAVIDRYSKGADAVQALKTGKVDCVVIDNEPAKAFVAENEGLVVLDTEYVEEQYAAAMNKDNTALYEAVNNALQELIEDGTVQGIIDKYIVAE